MRTIEEIRADIQHDINNGYSAHEKTVDLYEALTRDIPLDRIEELCQAERENRCVVLPCKIGDTVWIISDDEAVECTLTDTLVYKAKNYSLEIARKIDGICEGKQTVFLTREEAVNALKGEGHEQ